MFVKPGHMPGMLMNRITQSIKRVASWAPYFLGPWPIRPVEFGLAAFFLNQYAETRVGLSQNLSIQQGWTRGLPWSLTVAIAVGASFWLLRALLASLKNKGSQRAWYLLGTFVTIALLVVGLLLLRDRGLFESLSELPRVLVAALFLNAVLGFTEQRLLNQVRVAEAALAESEKHQRLLLGVDEAARRSVADFLHDNVQTRLVVAAMQLRQIISKIEGSQASELRSVLEELEEIRKNEVRLASRNLSPDITSLGLAGALKELASLYRNQIDVALQIGLAFEPRRPDLELGIYRIVEQTLLNAAVHGQASVCNVSLSMQNQNKVLLVVANNGRVLANGFVEGAGSAVIDAWVRKFNGTWQLQNAKPEGVELRATLNIGS